MNLEKQTGRLATGRGRKRIRRVPIVSEMLPEELIVVLLDIKCRLGDLKLWRTMHAMDAPTRMYGYERAEQLGDDGAVERAREGGALPKL